VADDEQESRGEEEGEAHSQAQDDPVERGPVRGR